MGKFGDFAAKKSDWLSVKPGEKVEVEWTGDAREVVGTYGDGFAFVFNTEFGVKKYTITAARLIAQFDDYKKGEKLVIDRSQANEKGQYPTKIYKAGEAPF